jgi:hypothetical protein
VPIRERNRRPTLSQKPAMTMQDKLKKAHKAPSIPNVLVPLSATADLALLKRPQLAKAINVSPRTVDNLQRKKIIPAIRLSPRMVRFHLPSVLAALRKFEIREAGR